MPTIRDLSLRCGVSVSTVSKALNGYGDVSEDTRQRIIEKANEIGYFPDANARALKLKKTYNIGVLYSDSAGQGLRNDFFAYVLAGFKDSLAARGYDLTFIEHGMGRRKMRYLEHCRNRNFDGICIVCADFKDEEVQELIHSDFHVVAVDYSSDACVSVLSDNRRGMEDLTDYIISRGHERIAYIYGEDSLVTRRRIEGYQESLGKAGIPFRTEYFVEGIYRNLERTEEITRKLLRLPELPTCIIAPDDLSAFGVIKVAAEKGMKIPDDISVAGYDGIPASQALAKKLTTVKQDADRIGAEAARQLISLVENPMGKLPDDICLKAQLVKGESVKKLNSGI